MMAMMATDDEAEEAAELEQVTTNSIESRCDYSESGMWVLL